MLTRTVRRYVIALSIVVLLLAAYAVAGFWAAPHFVRSGLSEFVSAHYKRKLTVGDIRFNPFTFTLDVGDFSLPDSDGRPMLEFGRLHVNLEAISLFRFAPSFREIVLERPVVRAVIRPDGTLNLADLGKGFASPPPAAPPPRPAEPMRLFIDRLAVVAGDGTFEDLSHATPFRAELRPIAFELRNFSTRARSGTGDQNEYSLIAASPQGERLDWRGTILLEPLSSHGTFAITDLQANTIWTYLQQPLALEIPSGIVAVKGEYTFEEAGGAPAIKVDVHDTTVSDLKLRPRHGTTDYIVLSELDVHETQVDLARRAVEVGKVSLTGGEVKAWLSPQGQLNLMELMEPAATDAAAVAKGSVQASGAGTATPAPSPAWTVSVPDISVDRMKVSTEDRQVTPALALVLSPVNIHVAGFNTSPGTRVDIKARTSINSSATLNATAQLAPGGRDVTAHVELAQLDLSMFQPYIAQRTAMTLQAGQLATQLDIHESADGVLSVTGDLGVSGLRTVDELKKSFIKWKDLRVAGIQYSSQPASLHIDSVTAREPYARVIIAPDRTVNVKEVLAGPAKGTPSLATQLGAANGRRANGVSSDASAQAASAKANPAPGDANAPATDANAKPADANAPATAANTKPAAAKDRSRSRKSQSAPASTAPSTPVMPISIGTVRILDGSANYADFWIQPNFAVGIQTLNGGIDGLSSDPKSRAKLKLEGKVDRYAPVTINGEMNLLATSVYSDFHMSFKGLELTTMTPYSARFAGYKIDKGKLSVDLSYKVDHRVLTADQRFVIDQLQLGEPVESPDAVHLPLKLAVALLKDRDGVINLPLPITGSLDDPQFKLGPIIWHAFVNLLVKAATAPFALLGHLFGGHGEEMKFVDFPAGRAELDDPSRQKLSALAKALQEHTQLQLEVPIVYSQELDGPVLAKRRLDQRLVARAHSEKSPRKQAAAGARTAYRQSSNKQAAAGSPEAAPQAAAASQGANRPAANASQSINTAGADAQDPALANPLEHYRLLLAEYEAELGKEAELPASVAAIRNAKNKKDAPPVESAIADLESALIGHIDVPELQLQELGKERTRAIQDALLSDGGIDSSRVFIINGAAKAGDDGKVRAEMSLK